MTDDRAPASAETLAHSFASVVDRDFDAIALWVHAHAAELSTLLEAAQLRATLHTTFNDYTDTETIRGQFAMACPYLAASSIERVVEVYCYALEAQAAEVAALRAQLAAVEQARDADHAAAVVELERRLKACEALRAEREDLRAQLAEALTPKPVRTGCDDCLEARRVLQAQLTQARDVLRWLVDWYGPWHTSDCPADDTCDCTAKPYHDAINALLAPTPLPAFQTRRSPNDMTNQALAQLEILQTPKHDRVFVLPLQSAERTQAGIIVPEAHRERPQRGLVVKIGRGLYAADTAQLVPMDVELGELITYGVYSGSDVTVRATYRGQAIDLRVINMRELEVQSGQPSGSYQLTHLDDLSKLHEAGLTCADCPQPEKTVQQRERERMAAEREAPSRAS